MTRRDAGLTLVELLVATAIIAVIAAAVAAMLATVLRAHDYGTTQVQLYSEGKLAMDRMTNGLRSATFVLIPNDHTPARDVLAFSGTVNDDNDFYFGEALFPRIDEDPGTDGDGSGDPGLSGVDDDGDGSTDEGATNDDDEDGQSQEDALDGLDDDGDGNVDEDLAADLHNSGVAGIEGMDDDGDGSTDEGAATDDDEDGSSDEDGLNPILYTYNSGANTLSETDTDTATTVVLSDQVTSFTATYDAPDRIRIDLTLTDAQGASVTFSEYAYPRNTLQRNGKRVR
jgi:prepilin-type N-terminal cleavage/methylation domain-containing protein